MAQGLGLQLEGQRAIYTPRHFHPGHPAAPKVKTKLICGKIVKVLEDEQATHRSEAYAQEQGLLSDREHRHRYTNGTELLAPYHTQPQTLNSYPLLPPIDTSQPAMDTGQGQGQGQGRGQGRGQTNVLELEPDHAGAEDRQLEMDRLYRSHLLPDGSLPDQRVHMTDDEMRLLRHELRPHLQDAGADRVMEIYEKLQNQRKHQVPLDEIQEALTRNMILIPPPLLKLAASPFVSTSQPGTVDIDKFVNFLSSSLKSSPRRPAQDSWTNFPAELVPVLKMLPRHNPVPYESILLRPNEREALMGHLRESLMDMEPSTLKEIYHDLTRRDRDMSGCVSYESVLDAFESRQTRTLLMPIMLRLLCAMHISRRNLGQVEYRQMLRMVEESLGTHFHPGPPALSLPPAPPRDLTHLLRLLPRHTDLPNDSVLLRESDKAMLIKHVKGLMVQVTEEEMRNLHLDLSQYDRSMNGALRYQDLSSVFMGRKINISPEILRLLACMFVSTKSPGHVDYKKFMLFLSAAQKGLSVDVAVVHHENSTLDGLPNPPATILPLLRELPKGADNLPSEPLSITKDERREILTYVENHLYEFDPIAIESMYNRMEELDRDGRRYIHFSFIREEIMLKKIPLHPMMVRLIAAMCVSPGTDSCVRYGQFLGFLGLALKRMPRIPDLMDNSQPPLSNEVLLLLKRLPRHGLPERALTLTSEEREHVSRQLGQLMANINPDQVMLMLDEFIILDKKGTGVVSLEMIKRILQRAQISLPERLVDLIAAVYVSQYYPDQVDFKEFLSFLDSVISEGSGRRPFRGHQPLPEGLQSLLKLVDDYANLPYQPLTPSEYQRVQLNKYLTQALIDVNGDDLNKVYEDLIRGDHYHDGAVPAHVIQSVLLKHRLPIHKDAIRILAAMFVMVKQMPHQVVDIKRLMMFLSSCLQSVASIDGDLPPPHSPGVPPLPAELLVALRSLPAGYELPKNPCILNESEKACLQEYLVAVSPSFSSEQFKNLYTRMADTDRYNSGSLSFKDIETAMQQFGWSVPNEALKLTLAQFVSDRTHGRVDYSKLVVFLNSTLNMASNKDFIELTRREVQQPKAPPEADHPPEMAALFRLLPPYYQLPLEPIALTDNEKEVLLDDIRRNVWPLDKNALKVLYQQLATMDTNLLGFLPFEDVKLLLRTKGVNIDPDVFRLIASQFVSTRMKGYVNYEDLINFMNGALKSPKLLPISDEPIGVRVDLPPPLVHVVSLLPSREPLPKAPLFLKESERTMLAEAIHDALRDTSENNLTQLHAEYVRLDTSHARTLTYADMLQAMTKFNVSLPIDVARLLMAQFVRDEGRVEYRGVVDFLKAAVRYIPDFPSSRMGYQSARDLPPPRIHEGKIKPLHGREDINLVRQINRVLSENYFNPDQLRDAFTSADIRRNGCLSAVQIREISKRHGAPLGDHVFDKIFEHLDYMGVGQFSWSQFVEFLQRCLDKGLD